MIPLPTRRGALTLVSAAGLGLLFGGPSAAFLTRAAAQAADASPAAAPSQTDAKGRHLAPHGTLYILSYVSVTTNTGVEGFVPGQEVQVVSADHAKHMLLVTDGKAQVEVSPAKLTNDIDIAALARQKDQANQAQIAAYTQAEEAAFAKHEREEAEAEARNDERQKQEAQQAADNRAVAQAAQSTQGAQQPVDASLGGSGYYDSGGYGYGSPYSYFFATRASGPGGGRGTLPSDRAATNSGDVQRGAGGEAAAGGAHAGGGHPGGGGGGKP